MNPHSEKHDIVKTLRARLYNSRCVTTDVWGVYIVTYKYYKLYELSYNSSVYTSGLEWPGKRFEF